MAFNTDMLIIAAQKMSTYEIVDRLSEGMVATLGIFFLTLLFALPLGLMIAFGRMSRYTIIRQIVKIYISVMRGTPLMLQLLVVYYGPYYLFGANIGNFRFGAIVVGFSLNYAAYFAEIYRSGIESMPTGQYEAARMLGYNKAQTFFKIICPQVIKRILPAVTNEIITLVKDTSLAFAIAYQEVFSLAKQVASSQTSFEPFIIAGIFYYIFNMIVASLMGFAEKKLSYYK